MLWDTLYYEHPRIQKGIYGADLQYVEVVIARFWQNPDRIKRKSISEIV